VELGNYLFTYHVVPKEWNPELPNFAFILANPENGYILGLSNEIAPEFQKYIAFHEYYEKMCLTGKGKCVKALEKELELVPGSIKPRYTQMRKDFFTSLISYAGANNYSSESIQEFTQSLNKLEDICSKQMQGGQK
jgi:hypothetical protein